MNSMVKVITIVGMTGESQTVVPMIEMIKVMRAIKK